ncbi:MAG: HAD family phosphatase [Ferruginibacter sp.]|nr:HAD family phosphatase [Ferruginibacter sp.]
MDLLQFDAFLFDMDGVLADTDPTHKLAFKKFLAEYNIDCTDEYFEKNISGNHNMAIAKMILCAEASSEELKQWGSNKEKYFRDLYAPIIKELDGVTPFLQWLKQHNKKLAVCTSAPKENLVFILDALNIRQYFAVLLCEDDVTEFKPHPQIYLKACELLNVQPQYAVVFEDSDKGSQAGFSAGCKVVLVNNNRLHNDSFYGIIQNFSQLNL